MESNLDEIEKAFEEGRTADACNMIEALLVEARLDELRVEEASRQRGGAIPLRLTNRIYELEKELRELEKQREAL